MKFSRSAYLRSVCVASLLGATFGASSLLAVTPSSTSPAPAVDAYTAAVNAYVDAASKEMAGTRKELDAADKEGKKAAYAGARAVFEKCDALVTRLKTAGKSEFDPTKAQYERNRTILQKKLVEARRAATAPAAQ